MSTKTTIAGGTLILVGGLALAIYANTNTSALTSAKATTVAKYIKLSDSALSKGDNKAAEKFAEKALATDPKNKEALAGFKKVVLASCPKSAVPTISTATTPAAAPAAAQPDTQPAAPAAEPEEEMGCI